MKDHKGAALLMSLELHLVSWHGAHAVMKALYCAEREYSRVCFLSKHASAKPPGVAG